VNGERWGFVGGGVGEKVDMDFWKMIVVHDRGSVALLFCITREILVGANLLRHRSKITCEVAEVLPFQKVAPLANLLSNDD
jgi:hypothetical protein